MKRNKVIGIISAVILSLAIILMACAPAAPPPPPAPAPTPTPAPAPKPPPKEEYIQLITSPEGQSVYFTALTLKDLLAKHSDWLRATVKAAGISNTSELARKPEIRKNTLVASNLWENLKARKAMAPYTEPYTGARVVLLHGMLHLGLMTLDPDIKTLEDLERLKVAVGPKGSVSETTMRWVLEELGLTVNLQYMGYGSMRDALRDGTLDVIDALSVFDGKKWRLHPQVAEIMETKKWYPVNYPPGVLEKIRETKGWVGGVGEIPTGSLPNQTRDWRGHIFYVTWYADESMDDRIVAEFLRVVYENIDEYVKAHIAVGGLTRERMAYFPIPEELFHSAAVKFYKDKGIPVGF